MVILESSCPRPSHQVTKCEHFFKLISYIHLCHSIQHVRLYATNYLGELIRTSSNANAWTLRLLLTQLYDPAADVCETAVRFLEEACEDKYVLQLVVEMQPTMDHLGEIGHPLLLKYWTDCPSGRYS